MDVFVARQPIFSRSREVVAYELLFRAYHLQTEFDGTESTSATMQLLANSLLSIGLENLVGGKKAFVNFDHKLLVSGLDSMLPPDRIVMEILETVEPSPELIARCRELRERGFSIALDDFTGEPKFDPFIEIANLIKLDVHATSQAEQERMIRAYQPRGITMLAEKVETAEEFERASGAGYDLFQGFFFARPAVVRGQHIPASRMNCLRMLKEMQKEDLDFDRLATMISQDLAFSYKLLRYVNSARFNHRTEISSIAQSLLILGEAGVRHWIALATIPQLAKDKPGELVMHSLVRASFCERLAKLVDLGESARGFLAGLFSLLDAILDVPLEEALGQVGIGQAINGVLLGTAREQDALRNVYLLATKYEVCEWKAVAALAAELGIDLSNVGRAYSEATLWAQQALNATVRRTDSRREARHPAEGNLRLRWKDSEGRERISMGKLKNISRSGLHLHVDEKIPVRTAVACNDPQLGISGRGSVRYCGPSKGKYQIGLEFSNGTGWSPTPS